ncbi:MAG: hypothetical protein BGO95_01405 [Micrococcales bacterium 73-13]|nr:MAG: hypothetical protein BGO95_01405 [Micrococcales bacterium 73-13]
MTNHIISAAIVVVIAAAAAWLMVWGWRRRARRQQTIGELPPVPAELGPATAHRAKYVATTTAGQPFDRVVARGLGFRGDAVASVHRTGLLVERAGEADIWIPADRLVGVDRATWTIDRVVEGNGLHLVRWRLGDQDVDTYLRLDEPRAFDDAVAPLIPKQVLS